MNNRRKLLVVAMTGCLALSANSAFSLGLGSIEAHSALGQPFHASIPFTSTLSENITPQDIGARLASRDEHARQGLPYPRMPKLKMTIHRNSSGQSFIQIKDTYPAIEPIVNMIVEVVWPGGRLFKTVTLLLDPPEYAVPEVPRESIIHVEKPVRRSSSELTVVKQAAGSDGRATPRVRNGKFIDVQSGDTLSEIAYHVYRQHGVDVITMMQVLYEYNPDAFGRTMNQLKAGVTLEIPPAEVFHDFVQGKSGVKVTDSTVSNRISSESDSAEGEKGYPPTDSDTQVPVVDTSGELHVIPVLKQLVYEQAPLAVSGQPDVVAQVDERTSNQQIDTEKLKLRLDNQQLNDDLVALGQDLKVSNSKIEQLQQTNEELTARMNELTETLKQVSRQAGAGSNGSAGWFSWLSALFASLIAGIMSILWWRERNQTSMQTDLSANRHVVDLNLSLDTDEIVPQPYQHTGMTQVCMENLNTSESEAEINESYEVGQKSEAIREQSLEDEMANHSLNDTYVEVRDVSPDDACFQDTNIRRIIFSSNGNEDSKLLMLTILKETGKDQEFNEMLEKMLSHYSDSGSEIHQKILQIARQDQFSVSDVTCAADVPESTVSMGVSPEDQYPDVAESGNDATELFTEDGSLDEYATELFTEGGCRATDNNAATLQEQIQVGDNADEGIITEVYDINELKSDKSEDRDYAASLPDLELLDEEAQPDKQVAGN